MKTKTFDDYDVAVGKIIKQARKARKYSVPKMVDMLDIKSKSTYFDYERGKIGLTIARFNRICEILLLDPVEVMEQARQEVKK